MNVHESHFFAFFQFFEAAEGLHNFSRTVTTFREVFPNSYIQPELEVDTKTNVKLPWGTPCINDRFLLRKTCGNLAWHVVVPGTHWSILDVESLLDINYSSYFYGITTSYYRPIITSLSILQTYSYNALLRL
eukprot:sb/3474995/